MFSDHLDDELRTVRAALSSHVGYTLPESLAAVAEANGIAVGGWVFPAKPESLALPELSEPTQLIAYGRKLLAQAEQSGVRMLVPGDAGWPSGTSADELPCLWVSGEADVAGLLKQAVTVTGSRACDAYGRQVAGDLAFSLAALGFTIVSASGFGIDHHAAAFTLAVGGRVVLVSAGSTAAGEQAHSLRPLVAGAAEAGGAVVGAFPPGTPVTRSRWAVQQHLLATLSAGVVVVQASRTSRALEVARLAAAAGRAVCAVPGPVTTEVSTGCHRLLADGTAALVSTSSDVLDAISSHASRHCEPDVQVFEVSGRASWDDGVWRSRTLPTLLIPAESPEQAAERAFGIAFVTRPGTCAATLDAAVRGPDAAYHTFQITSTS